MTARNAVLVAMAFVFASSNTLMSQAAVDEEKAAAIREYLAIVETADQIITGMETELEAQGEDPNLPAGFYDRFLEVARDSVGSFLEMLVPVYDELATLEEIEAMIELMKSPAGKRALEIETGAATQMMPLAEQWGMLLAGQVLMDMAREGATIP